MIDPIEIRRYTRSSYIVTLHETGDAIQRRYTVTCAVHDGVKYQEKRIGAKYGYTQRGRAVKVYDAEVAQIDRMLTKQGR